MAIMRHTADRGFPREGVDTFTHGFLPSVKGGKWDKQTNFIETPAKKDGLDKDYNKGDLRQVDLEIFFNICFGQLFLLLFTFACVCLCVCISRLYPNNKIVQFKLQLFPDLDHFRCA